MFPAVSLIHKKGKGLDLSRLSMPFFAAQRLQAIIPACPVALDTVLLSSKVAGNSSWLPHGSVDTALHSSKAVGSSSRLPHLFLFSIGSNYCDYVGVTNCRGFGDRQAT